MKMKRFWALALTLCMLLSAIGPSTVCAVTRGTTSENISFSQLNGDLFDLDLTKGGVQDDRLTLEEQISDDEVVKVIIVMESESVVEADGTAVLDDRTQSMMEALADEQDQVVAEIESAVLDGEVLEISYSYTWLLNGVAAAVPYGTISQIEKISGVKQVLLQPRYDVCKTAEPNTVSDGVMIGRENVWANGYTGKGIKIAVVDTGLDIDHQNFAALPEDKLTDTSADADTVAAVLDQLNAGSRYRGLTVDDVYYNTKVAFGFNYCDNNLNIGHDLDGMGDHGTHVAGIAAANKVDSSDVVGVAPDAQLYIMKVFGENGGAYTDDILAALEDALILGADVVNMSLGTPAGFTSNIDEINTIYARVAETNTVLCVSAGNNYTAGYGNTWGTNSNLTTNPDNAVIGAPAVYGNVMSVASVENWKIQRNYILVSDGHQMGYVDTSASYEMPGIMTLTEAYSLVKVPGYGAAEDFEGLDLTGKIALIQRGVESFSTKCQNAAEAGAVACIVYNNTTGEFGMDLTDCTAGIPGISITMADGEYLIAAMEKDPGLTVSFPEDTVAMPNAEAYKMSEFSSWGAAPDLTLEPDITAPGGNIYSTLNGGEYGLMSGTSMASPNMAGISALVMEYVKENYDEAALGVNYRTLVQYLLISASVPLLYDEESSLYYSPRQQGSGLANAFNSISSQVYLTVNGSDTPKVELGADPDKTGAYRYTFNVTNFGDTTAWFDLNTVVQTEDYYEVEDYEGVYFMSGTPLALAAATAQNSDQMALKYDVDNNGTTDSHDAYLIYLAATGLAGDGWKSESFRYDLDGDETVTTDDVQAYLDALVGLDSPADLSAMVLKVEAGQSAEVSVSIDLADSDREYLDTFYANGGYVEGFTFLTALNEGGVDLSLPYMGFYGDWDAAPILDDGFYWELFNEDENAVVGNQYVNVLWTQYYGFESYFYPGLNAYVDESFDPAHISVSPNGDGFIDTVDDIYVSLLRNARYLTFRYVDRDTGEIYYDQTVEYVSKSAYAANYGEIVPTVYSWYDGEIVMWDWKDSNGNDLSNNTTVVLQVEATGDYEGATPDMWEIPIVVDLEAPELLNVQRVVDNATGDTKLELTFRDNLSCAAVGLMSSDGSTLYAWDAVEDVEPDENGYQNYTVSYDITDITGKLMIVLADYAMNESYYGLNTGGAGASYGELIAYQYDFYNDTYGWVAFGEDVDEDEIQITMDAMNFVCAEYVNGFVFAQTETGALYGFRYADMLADTFDIESTYITDLELVYQDFSYNYVDGQLYGLYSYEDSWGDYYTELYSIDIGGHYTEEWAASRGGLFGYTLAFADDGTGYVLGTEKEEVYNEETGEYTTVDSAAELWRYGEDYIYGMYVMRFSKIGDTGIHTDYTQSMTYDHNNGKLYWAQFNPTSVFTYECGLYTVDMASGAATKVGTLTGETCGLFAPLTAETIESNEIYQNVPEMDPDAIGQPVLRSELLTMNVGSQKELVYDLDPWYTAHREVVWSSSDESVVTVDENGLLTAVSTGTAVITVANADDESKYDTCTVNVTALTLNIEGIISAQTAGVGSTTGTSLYKYVMEEGVASFGTTNPITAPPQFSGFGLSIATSVRARDSIYACEYGNTGMVYQIDAETGVVTDVLEPVDGDMLFGMTYNEELDTFAAIMDMYLFVDLELTHEEEELIKNSYDNEQKAFMYHRLNMLDYLIAAGGNFVTGEDGQGASSEIVMCGVTTIKDPYYYEDTGLDFLGEYAMGSMYYNSTQTLVVLDNVGRLWYIDEICGLNKESIWGGYATEYTSATDPDTYIQLYSGQDRNGLMEIENADGTYNLFYIRAIEETPLTDMFRQGTMPRITYHFSDIEFGGYTEDGAPIFAMSLYDYWNNGTTNELYLYAPATANSAEKFYSLGNTGEHNIIASIHSFEVIDGLD